MIRSLLLLWLGFFCLKSQALEVSTGRVMQIEATYLPSVIPFSLDTGAPSCPAGSLLKWSNPDQSNVRAVYAMLLTSLVSGKQVRAYINDGDTGCNVAFIYIFSGQ